MQSSNIFFVDKPLLHTSLKDWTEVGFSYTGTSYNGERRSQIYIKASYHNNPDFVQLANRPKE